ncbi:MAG: tRNA 2-thiouridine(34) synthase MnmA [Lentisphaeria bacterium]|nr:tRNA 2-thiouridine(34) synthase MnmA [Lentisphaeria bacterium]NQZ68352.1 tRNA 2-thiouridine(34) synthase MnmA [Lentisphaeria bacterium]
MKIAVLISGGVDSSVALRLLLDQGHEVHAFYLKIWLEDDLAFLGECPWEDDMLHVRKVCEQYNVPMEIVPLQKEYWDRVVDYAIRELKQGRTPSPDIFCNQRIKFGAFFDAIDDSFEKVATGHYAQTEDCGDHVLLKRAPDPVKDQTYFLSHLNQKQMQRILFPIGHLQKNAVRELAEQFDLPNKNRKDSQGICFLGKIKYPDFVKAHLGEKEGAIVDINNGKSIGTHNGFWFHTIGQRTGLGLGGGPWYVVKKEPDDNIVFVAHADHYKEDAKDSLLVSDASWIYKAPEKGDLQFKLRHGPNMLNGHITTIANGQIEIKLEEKDSGVAPGQFCIFYDGDYCLGGAAIL